MDQNLKTTLTKVIARLKSLAKYTAGKGIKIVNNEVKIDLDVTATVDYVDGTVTDVLFYVDQQDNSEHAGRVAGDNLLNARIVALEDKKSNWEQNDSSQLDFIKNRTHWVELIPTRYSNSDVNFAESGVNVMAHLYGYNQYPEGFLDNLITGNELAVEIDGVVRRGIIRNLNSSYWIGNGHMLLQSAEDTGEDWCVGTMSRGFDTLRVILPPSYEGTHDVDVILSEQTVHKLDAKFLPDVLNSEMVTIAHQGVNYKLSDIITALIDANVLNN